MEDCFSEPLKEVDEDAVAENSFFSLLVVAPLIAFMPDPSLLLPVFADALIAASILPNLL